MFAEVASSFFQEFFEVINTLKKDYHQNSSLTMNDISHLKYFLLYLINFKLIGWDQGKKNNQIAYEFFWTYLKNDLHSLIMMQM